MNNDALLKLILPDAITWVEYQSTFISAIGLPLNSRQMDIAKRVGVTELHKVRLLMTDRIPLPSSGVLRETGLRTGLIDPDLAGMAFGHSIVITKENLTNRLLSHELRHVHQYERFGSIAAFMAEYLSQIISVGYEYSALELDAQAYEIP
jgi:hypothetical protein